MKQTLKTQNVKVGKDIMTVSLVDLGAKNRNGCQWDVTTSFEGGPVGGGACRTLAAAEKKYHVIVSKYPPARGEDRAQCAGCAQDLTLDQITVDGYCDACQDGETEDTMRTTCFTCGLPTDKLYGKDLYGGSDCQCHECYLEEVEYRAQERHREHMNSMAGVGTMGSDKPLHCRMNKPL